MRANRIKTLTDSDKDALALLARCGNATTATLKDIGLSPSRIENLGRDRWIQPVDKGQKYQHKNDEAVWALTPKGKTGVRKNLNIDHCFNGTNAIRHNAEVAKVYTANLQREDVAAILTESETRALVKGRIEDMHHDDSRLAEYWEWNEKFITGEMSMPDVTIITTTGTVECYEVITNNYGQAEIAAKETTIEFLEAVFTKIYI